MLNSGIVPLPEGAVAIVADIGGGVVLGIVDMSGTEHLEIGQS